jgi:3-oxoacyl-[acyl-carrier protein] reductase
MRVVIADLADAEETVALIARQGGDCSACRCDVAEPDSVRGLADAARERYGSHADVLVANAGIYPIGPLAEVSFEQWRRVMAVNLDSLFLLTQAFLPEMRAAGWGRIVATATNGFHTGLRDMTPYVASKGGVIGFVRSLAGEVGDDGVTVNAIAPTLTRTKGTREGPHEQLGLFEAVPRMQAIKRPGQPEDLVGAVSFLVSDDAAFITGQTLAVDGGLVRA